MGVLADHEGLYEGSRMIPALIVAVVLFAGAGVVALFVWRRCGRPSLATWPGRFIGLALMAALSAAALGAVPRATRGGYNICGPVLHTGRVDSNSCDGVLRPLPALMIASAIASALLCAAALALPRQPVSSEP